MSTPTVRIDPGLTLNEVALRHPRTLTVFHAAGLDTCCGGSLPIAEAAARHRLDLDRLLAELSRAAAAEE